MSRTAALLTTMKREHFVTPYVLHGRVGLSVDLDLIQPGM